MGYYDEVEKEIRDYIEETEDKTILTEKEEVILKHFRSEYPKFDLMIEKWMYQSLVDLYTEGSTFWENNTQWFCEGSFYHNGFHVVDYGRYFSKLEEESFGTEDWKNEVEIQEEGYREFIFQMESDFVDELFDYSKEVVFSIHDIRIKLGSPILSDLLDELFSKRLFVVPIKELNRPELYEEGWEGGSFTHPKLQKNWCYNYLKNVPLVLIPLTDNLRERVDNKTIFLDTKKVDFHS